MFLFYFKETQTLRISEFVPLQRLSYNHTGVKRHIKRQGPIGMHCDAPKWVPDPFPSVNPSVKTSKLPLDA